jgi:transposase
MAPIQAELRELLEYAARKSKRTRLHRRFAANLLKISPALFTFVTVEGVEPTNNAAERALRGPVIYRKLSHGTRSHDGERFIERILSASVTCRLQHRSLFAYLAELLATHARGDPLPTLA